MYACNYAANLARQPLVAYTIHLKRDPPKTFNTFGPGVSGWLLKGTRLLWLVRYGQIVKEESLCRPLHLLPPHTCVVQQDM